VALDLDALEDEARALLESGAFDYIAGGAEDEVTLADNVAAWKRLRLRPKILRDVSAVDTTTTLLGDPVASPIGIAPTAFHRLAHPDGEEASAQAADKAGALMVLSTRATASAADVRAAAPGALLWFQVYVLTDRGRTTRLVEAAVAQGCKALVLTADTPFLGRRLRDVRNRFVLPTDIGDASSSLTLEPGEEGSLIDQDPSITFDDIGWLAETGKVPVVVKGVLRADDASRCIDAGAAGVWVSNHGGRQLDGAVATADALPEVVAAVGERAEVYVDGGVRHGSDVLKGLALGARAVFVGRPALWGLATGGSAGVARVLAALQHELAHAMSLAGAPTITDLTADLVAG
jgi:4-hydroxymandelate oxidase